MKKNLSQYTTRILLIAAFLFVIAAGAWFVHLTWHSIQLVSVGRQAQAALAGEAGSVAPAKIADLVHRGAVHITAVEQDMHVIYPLLRVIAWLPRIGPILGQAPSELSMAAHLAQAGDEVVQGLEPVWAEPLPNAPVLSTSERLFQAVQSGQPAFVKADKFIQLAAKDRQSVKPDLIPWRVRGLYLRLDENFSMIEQGVKLFPLLPELMGNTQPYRYLIVAQNRDEMRATGGFISGLGIARLEQGRIAEFDIGDSYRVDDFTKQYPSPPEPLHRLMLADYWVTRDANWSPDFPTAASQIKSLYTLSTGVQVQGVVAFDQLTIRMLLEALGPIQLPDFSEPVTVENVVPFMQQAWAPSPGQEMSQDWWLHRKDFMKQLGKAMLDKVFQSRDPKVLLLIAHQLMDALQEGHLLVYFEQPDAQAWLTQAGLGHSIDPGQSDYLMLVDSNIGFNKTDTVVQRAVKYQIDLRDPKQPRAQATMTYQHTSQADVACKQESSYGNGTYADMQGRCYFDYWRVYTPQGTVLLASNAQAVPAEILLSKKPWGTVEIYAGEGNTQVFAGVMVLPTRQSQQIILQYALPDHVTTLDELGQLHYILRIQKQDGLASLPLQMEIQAPDGYTLVQSEPVFSLAGDGLWTWSGDVINDRSFTLIFTPPHIK